MIDTPLNKLINLAGGQTSLARKVTESGTELTQSTISAWVNRFQHKVGAEYVVAVSAAVAWKVTPHELRSDIYPHPEDGLPEEMRCTCKAA